MMFKHKYMFITLTYMTPKKYNKTKTKQKTTT